MKSEKEINELAKLFVGLEKGKEMYDKIVKELSHYNETGIPRCNICKTPMENAIDTRTKKVDKHIWKTTCGHNINLRLSIG